MKSIKGPAIFLAQFVGDEAAVQYVRFDLRLGGRRSVTRACRSPAWDSRFIDLAKAAESKTYCEELKGVAGQAQCPDHRARDPPAGSAGGRQSGL